MTVILSVSETARKIMELIDRFNRESDEVKVEVNWRYWLENAAYVERYGDEYTIVSKDGLVLKVYDNTKYNAGVTVKLDSLHAAMCECYCGE